MSQNQAQNRVASEVIIEPKYDFDYSLPPSYTEVIPMPILVGIGLFGALLSAFLLFLYSKWINKP